LQIKSEINNATCAENTFLYRMSTGFSPKSRQ